MTPDPARLQAVLRADLRTWEALEKRSRLEASLGMAEKAWASLQAALRLQPRSPYLHLMAAHRLEELGRYREALGRCRKAVSIDPGFWEAWGKKHDLEKKLGLESLSRRSLLKSAEALLRRAGSVMTAVEMFDNAGEHGRAMALLRPLPDPAARRRLAELHLWLGDAPAALRACPDKAWRISGAAAVLSGDPRGALCRLSRAIAEDPRDMEARVWRAEARLRLGDFRGALADIAASAPLSDEVLAAPVVAALARIGMGTRIADEQYAVIRELMPPAWKRRGSLLSPDDPAGSRRILEGMLRGIAGNRSHFMTHVVLRDGRPRLRSYRGAGLSSRLLGAQARLLSGGLAETLSRFERLRLRHPDEAAVYTHRGEVLLWAGRYREALSDFARALRCAKKSRWTRVGLASAQLLLGDTAAALRSLRQAEADGAPEWTWRFWRGEALRRSGRTREAREDLRASIAISPSRLGARINLGLAEGSAGLQRVLCSLRRQAPHFMAVAARSSGTRRPDAVLLKALELLRGNRSSWLHTYVDDAGSIRPIHVEAP